MQPPVPSTPPQTVNQFQPEFRIILLIIYKNLRLSTPNDFMLIKYIHNWELSVIVCNCYFNYPHQMLSIKCKKLLKVQDWKPK